MTFRILQERTRKHDQTVMLCELPHNPATPYVTWVKPTFGSSRERYWGHYFSDFEAAQADFNVR